MFIQANLFSVATPTEYTMEGLYFPNIEAKFAHISFMLAKAVRNPIVIVVSNLKLIMV